MGKDGSDVSITVIWDDNDRTVWDRLTFGHGRAITAAAIALAAVAIAVSSGVSHQARTAPPPVDANAEVTDGGAPNGYPLHCVTVSASGGYSRASLDNAPACGPVGSYSTAIFRRAADGRWVSLRR